MIIQRKGRFYVLTNRHVFRNARPTASASTWPTAGNSIPSGSGRTTRPTSAVLAVEAPDLIAAPVGDSDRMEIGDFVLAVGSPFGLSHSVTFGIISARGRHDLHLGDAAVRFQDFLQTDAAINPGNSGGPLCNLRGEIIGINTAIASNSGGNEGIGFSIPINMFMAVARQLIDTGKVTRAFLGVSLDATFRPGHGRRARPAAAASAPACCGVTKGSPAEAAGIAPGDVILQFDGIRVDDDAPPDQSRRPDRGRQEGAAGDLPRRQDLGTLGGNGRPQPVRREPVGF